MRQYVPGEPAFRYAVDDLTVTRGTGAWGGPTAAVIVNGGPLDGRAFTLKSTEGLEPPVSLSQGGGIHLEAFRGDSPSVVDWRGVFDTLDMGEALGSLVGYLNDLAERDLVYHAVGDLISVLQDAISDFADSLSESSRDDWRECWPAVQRAATALAVALPPAGRAAPPG